MDGAGAHRPDVVQQRVTGVETADAVERVQALDGLEPVEGDAARVDVQRRRLKAAGVGTEVGLAPGAGGVGDARVGQRECGVRVGVQIQCRVSLGQPSQIET